MLPHSSAGGVGPPDPPARGGRSWFDAWIESAYGADGFWRIHSPDEHFRTAAASGPMIAQMLAAVVDRHNEIAHVVDPVTVSRRYGAAHGAGEGGAVEEERHDQQQDGDDDDEGYF